MAGVVPMETRKDTMGGTLHASRNHNMLRHTYTQAGANRAGVDWTLTLRQVPRKALPGAGNTASASAPNLGLAEHGESRWREPLACEHPEGAYHDHNKTIGRYQNTANTGHMLGSLKRVSSGTAHGVDWMLNLRGGMHNGQHADSNWKRHYGRGQVSFDMMKENHAKETYTQAHTTPHDRRPDRATGAMPITMVRETPISFKRWPGAEGTHVGQWQHLIEDRKRGYKVRSHLQHETTLREYPGDGNGAQIRDNRSDGCIVEMLGKKKWHTAKSHDALSAKWPEGDTKLYHLHYRRVPQEPDEDNREKRKSKHKRTDDHISEEHVSKERGDEY